MNIGAAIKKLRQEKKLTLEELADLAHTSKPNLSNLERNAQGFSPVILSSLAKALGMKVSEIFQLAESMEESSATADRPEPGTEETDELLAILDGLSPQRRQALLGFLKTWAGDAEA